MKKEGGQNAFAFCHTLFYWRLFRLDLAQNGGKKEKMKKSL